MNPVFNCLNKPYILSTQPPSHKRNRWSSFLYGARHWDRAQRLWHHIPKNCHAVKKEKSLSQPYYSSVFNSAPNPRS